MGLIGSLKNIIWKFEPPLPQKVTFFGNRAVAVIISEVKMRSYFSGQYVVGP